MNRRLFLRDVQVTDSDFRRVHADAERRSALSKGEIYAHHDHVHISIATSDHDQIRRVDGGIPRVDGTRGRYAEPIDAHQSEVRAASLEIAVNRPGTCCRYCRCIGNDSEPFNPLPPPSSASCAFRGHLAHRARWQTAAARPAEERPRVARRLPNNSLAWCRT